MTDALGESVSGLADGLSRLASGTAEESEIVRWLRFAASHAPRVAQPEPRRATRAYTRTLIHRTDGFEILVLHWAPGAVTPIHDHGGSHCWFAVAAGRMGVENFRRFDTGAQAGHARVAPDGRTLLDAGAIDYRQDDVHLHRCFVSDEPAVTLHVYAKPIERFSSFDERTELCADVFPIYDAVISV